MIFYAYMLLNNAHIRNHSDRLTKNKSKPAYTVTMARTEARGFSATKAPSMIGEQA